MSILTLEALHKDHQDLRKVVEELQRGHEMLRTTVLSDHEPRLSSVEDAVRRSEENTATILQAVGNAVSHIGRLANLVTGIDGNLQIAMKQLKDLKETIDAKRT